MSAQALDIPVARFVLSPYLQRKDATVIRAESKPARDSPALQRLIGSVEVDITVERALGIGTAKPKREGSGEELVQQLDGRDIESRFTH